MGNPIVQTIEKTGKKWKGLSVVAMLIITAGIVLGVAGAESGWNGSMIAFGVLLFVFGIGVSFVARLGAWWYHG